MKRGFTVSESGFNNIAFILFMFVFSVILTISIEFYNLHTIKNGVEVDILRALNTSIELAMRDEYRSEGVAWIDTTKARNEFYKYFRNDLGYNSNMELRVDGEVFVQIAIDDITLEESPPSFRVKGRILSNPVLLRGFVGGSRAEIPFNLAAQNRRM